MGFKIKMYRDIKTYLFRSLNIPPKLFKKIGNIPDADDVNLVGGIIGTKKINTEDIIDASKEVGLEVNTEKTKYMLLSRHQNARENHDIKMANRCFENVA
jgi:hypothetical protein